jgi:DNA-binding LacI/PurR family transcriptional regulator
MVHISDHTLGRDTWRGTTNAPIHRHPVSTAITATDATIGAVVLIPILHRDMRLSKDVLTFGIENWHFATVLNPALMPQQQVVQAVVSKAAQTLVSDMAGNTSSPDTSRCQVLSLCAHLPRYRRMHSHHESRRS